MFFKVRSLKMWIIFLVIGIVLVIPASLIARSGGAKTSLILTTAKFSNPADDEQANRIFLPVVTNSSQSTPTPVSTSPSTATATATNNPPIAGKALFYVDEDSVGLFDLLLFSSDADNDALTLMSVSSPSNGEALIQAGEVIYSPGANFSGIDQFNYTVSDGTAASIGIVQVVIAPVNDPPIVRSINVEVAQDSSVSISPLDEAADIDNDRLTLAGVGEPNYGAVVINGENIIYTPITGLVGVDVFSFTISDGYEQTTADVELFVTKFDADLASKPANAYRTAIPVTVFSVNTLDDTADSNVGDGLCADLSGMCSLRAAIEENNAQSVTTQISLPAGQYILTNGQLRVKHNLDLLGVGLDQVIVDGNKISRVFMIDGANLPTKTVNVQITGVTIQGGSPKSGAGPESWPAEVPPGGGIYIGKGSALTLKQSRVWQNETRGPGSGIANEGFLYVIASTIEGNKNDDDNGTTVNRWHVGGGLANWGTAYIEQSFVRNNSAPRGGGIVNGSGRLGIKNSSVSFNSAKLYGGGLAIYDGVVSITFSTITNNKANHNVVQDTTEPRVGGGIYFLGKGSVNIGNSMIAGNSDNRSISENEYSPDCYAMPSALSSYRGNIVGILTTNCGLHDFEFGDTRFDYVGTTNAPIVAELNPLVVDHANPRFACPPSDQFGTARPQDGDGDGNAVCDIGAIEIPARVGFVNLAIGSQASQSSTAFDGEALRAIDGETNGDFAAGSVTHTNLENQPFWQTGLGAQSTLSSVELWNRSDCCAERLENFCVLVSPTDLSGIRDLTTARNQKDVYSFCVTNAFSYALEVPLFSVRGRYVRVQLAGTDYLSLAEVRIWSQAAPNTPPIANSQVVTTVQGAAISITLTASDAESDLLAYQIVSQPKSGILHDDAPYLVYTPTRGFTGNDTFTFKANDGKLDSNIATITVEVKAVNPQGVILGRVLHEGQPVAQAAVTLTAIDPLVLQSEQSSAAIRIASPTNGMIQLFTNANGEFRHTAVPEGNYTITASATISGTTRLMHGQTQVVGNETTVMPVTLQQIPAANRSVVISGSIAIAGSATEVYAVSESIALDPGQRQQSVFIQRCAGDSVQVVLDLQLQLLDDNHSVAISGEARLGKGASCASAQPQNRANIGSQVEEDNTTSTAIALDNGGVGDSAQITLSFSNMQQASNIAAPMSPQRVGRLVVPDHSVDLLFQRRTIDVPVTVNYARRSLTPISIPGASVSPKPVQAFSLDAYDNNGAQVKQFREPYTLTVAYSDGVLAGLGIDESTLRLVYNDGAKWVDSFPCAGCMLDPINNVVTAKLNHFTEFALVGEKPTTEIYLPLIVR